MDDDLFQKYLDTRLFQIERDNEDWCDLRSGGTTVYMPIQDVGVWFGPVIEHAVRDLEMGGKMAFVVKVLIYHNNAEEMREIFNELESETLDQKAGEP